LGLSLNLPTSMPGAGVGGGEGVSPAAGAKGVAGADGVANSGGEGAITCGFAIEGGTIESVNKTGAFAAADTGSMEPGAAGGRLASSFGLKRIFGTGGGSEVAGSGVSVNSGGGGGAAVKDGSCSTDGKPGGCPSAGRSRGFNLRAGGGCACSSLIRREEPIIGRVRKEKSFPRGLTARWPPLNPFLT
jgi:hypothetical protein